MIIGIAIATISFSNAQQDQNQMNQINQIELPMSVQEDLTVGEFSEWSIVEAYEIPEASRKNNEAYQVMVQKEDQMLNLYYDSEGNLIRQEKKGKANKNKK